MALIYGTEPMRVLPIAHPSDVGAARREVHRVGTALGLGSEVVARAELATTEAAGNMLRHVGSGEIWVQTLRIGAERRLEVFAVDSGPGIPWPRALEDGFSTSTGPGWGMGAMQRQSDMFSVATATGAGSVVYMAFGDVKNANAGFSVGGTLRAYPGAQRSGDAWVASTNEEGDALVLVIDALGHGDLAADASLRATEALSDPKRSLDEVYESLVELLRGGRSGVCLLARLEAATGQLDVASVGNIVGTIRNGDETHRCITRNGTIGLRAKPLVQRWPWSTSSSLLCHSDGVHSAARDAVAESLLNAHPSAVAATIMRDRIRGTDDALVVVLAGRRQTAPLRSPT